MLANIVFSYHFWGNFTGLSRKPSNPVYGATTGYWSTVPDDGQASSSQAGVCLLIQELLMVIWFMLEFTARVWSAGCRSRYQCLSGRVQFVRRPLCIVGKFTSLLSPPSLLLRLCAPNSYQTRSLELSIDEERKEQAIY